MHNRRAAMIMAFVLTAVLQFPVFANGGIAKAQAKLKELGYDPGSADGEWGPKTKGAVEQFQRDSGLTVSGQLDNQTQEKLGVPKAQESTSGMSDRDKIINDSLISVERSGSVTSEKGAKFDIVGGMLGKRGDWKVPVLKIAGWPFVPSLQRIDAEMPEKIVLRIESFDSSSKKLRPTPDSLVPEFEPEQKDDGTRSMIPGATRAVNVVWEFTKAGITFEADGSTYRADKPNATISFTKDGVKLEGIQKLK